MTIVAEPPRYRLIVSPMETQTLVLSVRHPQVLALTLFYAGRYHLRFRRWQEIRLSDLCLSPYLTS